MAAWQRYQGDVCEMLPQLGKMLQVIGVLQKGYQVKTVFPAQPARQIPNLEFVTPEWRVRESVGNEKDIHRAANLRDEYGLQSSAGQLSLKWFKFAVHATLRAENFRN